MTTYLLLDRNNYFQVSKDIDIPVCSNTVIAFITKIHSDVFLIMLETNEETL